MITVADVIKQLEKFPKDMEVWTFWDESGECFPCKTIPGVIEPVEFDKERNRWEFGYKLTDEGTKHVIMLHEDFRNN